VRVDALGEACDAAVFGDDLLDAAGGIGAVLLGLKQVLPVVAGDAGINVGTQGEAERVGEKYVAVFGALAVVYEDFAGGDVYIGDFDAAQFRDADGCVQEQAEEELVLEVVGAVEGGEVGAEGGFGEELGELTAAAGGAEVEVLAGLGGVSAEEVVGEVVAADEGDEFTGGSGEFHTVSSGLDGNVGPMISFSLASASSGRMAIKTMYFSPVVGLDPKSKIWAVVLSRCIILTAVSVSFRR